VTLDELALEIQRALQNRDATSDRRHLPDMHSVIVRVLREYVAEHELEKMSLLDAWVNEKEKLEHRISELEARIEELNKH
jgi:predicted ribosome quality control (RQC) complex YloA/Tae2 family protein